MMKSKLIGLALAGLLSATSISAFAGAAMPPTPNGNETAPATPGVGGGTGSGSVLPPGTNPSTPSGGNGADANGRYMDKGTDGAIDSKPRVDSKTGTSNGTKTPGVNNPKGTSGY